LFHEGDLFFDALFLLLLRLSFNVPWLGIGVILYFFIRYKRFKNRILLPALLSGFLILSFIYASSLKTEIPNEGIVIKNESQHVIKTNEGIFVAHFKETIPVASKISFKATLQEINPVYLIGQFDYDMYLKSQNIKGALWLEEVEIVGESFGLYSIIAIISNYLENTFDAFLPYIQAFVLGDTHRFDDGFFEKVRFLGVSHIFALSGLHVTFLSNTLDKRLSRFNKPKTTLVLISLFLFIYLAISNFRVSFIRAFFLYLFLSFNRLFKKDYTPLDGLSLIFILSLIFNPFIIFDSGFLLSYSVTAGLLLIYPLLASNKGFLYVSLIAFLVTLPLVLKLNGFVNITSVLINIPMVLFLGILLPVSYLVLIFPFIEPLFTPLIILFEWSIETIYRLFFMPVSLPLHSSLHISLYYLFLGFFMVALLQKKYRLIYPLIGFVLVLKIIPFLNLVPKVTMLAVDGDAFLIKDRFQQCNILIDGGDLSSASSLVKHLKLSGIKTIHKMIATHNHKDHIAGLEVILNDPYFNVLEVVTSEDLVDSFNIETCGSIQLMFYPKAIRETTINNSSVILGVFIQERSLLFTGDIEEIREKEFEEYPLIDYDILKVAHHGSSTSTSDLFLDHTNPSIALINLPYFNRHNFPSEEVLNRFKERSIDYYQTDKNGNVRIYFFNNKTYIISDE